MRALLTILFLIFFSQTAYAIKNEDLNNACKPYVNANSDFTKMEKQEIYETVNCMFYFEAIIDLLNATCRGKTLTLNFDGIALNAELPLIDSYIEDYVTKMNESKDKSNDLAIGYVLESMLKITGECPN